MGVVAGAEPRSERGHIWGNNLQSSDMKKAEGIFGKLRVLGSAHSASVSPCAYLCSPMILLIITTPPS
jgi:hypothetical protein